MRKLLLIFFVVSLSVLSCRKEIDLPSWENRLMVPIIHTVMDPFDILADSNLIINNQDYYSLRMDQELFRFAVDSLVEIPDTLLNNFFKPFLSITIQPGQKILDLTYPKIYDFNGAALSEIRIKSGFLKFEVINTTNERILCTYTINSATRCGDPFTFTEVAPANSSTVFSSQYDFSGYTVDLRGIGLDSVNTVVSNFKAWVHPDGQPVTLQPTDSFYINVHFVDLVLDYARGYFGTRNYEIGPKSMPFSVFETFKDGSLSFEQAKFALNVSNSFGVDVRMKLKSLEAFNTKKGTSAPLISPLINKTVNISRAEEFAPGMGFKQATNFSYDLSTSNMKNIFEMMPDRFEYEIEIANNPLGNISNGNDFMYHGLGVLATLQIDLPLSLRADTIVLEQKSGWTLDIGQLGNNFQGGSILARFENSFPFDAWVTMILMDKTGNVIDTLALHQHIAASQSDPLGKLIKAVVTELKIPADKQRVEGFEEAKTLFTRITFNTTHKPGFVRFYPEHKVDLTISGDFNMRWEP